VPSGCRCWSFAREGAQAFVTGRSLAPLERVVTKIKQAGGAARIAQVDALDEAANERHRDQMVEEFRGVMSPSLPFTESKTV
jgi:3-oxoacyl-[acyl-carrier protein] reductase